MTSESACYRTPKVALVAFLRLREFSYERMELQNDQVVWVFSDSDALQREVEIYRLGEAIVEPVAFTRASARVKDEMFAFKREQEQGSQQQGAAAR